MFYTVFSTNVSPYMQWQSDLLEHSWKSVGQDGALVRLVATDDPDNLPTQRHAQCIATTLWDNHPVTNDWYPIYNKPASLLEWLYRHEPQGNVLLIDPDCVFRRPVRQRVAKGAPIAQHWVDLRPQAPSELSPFGLGKAFAFIRDHCARTDLEVDPVMIPTLIHSDDLRRVCLRWLELLGIMRQNLRRDGQPVWETDMFAYIVACAEFGIRHQPASLGICTNWHPDDAPDAPIIHYCQTVRGAAGEPIFGKSTYRPWDTVDETIAAEHEYGRDMVNIVNGFVGGR